jgi:hypothetical protein
MMGISEQILSLRFVEGIIQSNVETLLKNIFLRKV